MCVNLYYINMCVCVGCWCCLFFPSSLHFMLSGCFLVSPSHIASLLCIRYVCSPSHFDGLASVHNLLPVFCHERTASQISQCVNGITCAVLLRLPANGPSKYVDALLIVINWIEITFIYVLVLLVIGMFAVLFGSIFGKWLGCLCEICWRKDTTQCVRVVYTCIRQKGCSVWCLNCGLIRLYDAHNVNGLWMVILHIIIFNYRCKYNQITAGALAKISIPRISELFVDNWWTSISVNPLKFEAYMSHSQGVNYHVLAKKIGFLITKHSRTKRFTTPEITKNSHKNAITQYPELITTCIHLLKRVHSTSNQ